MEPNWLSGPLPFDLGMALVENPRALERYAGMERAEKERLIREAPCHQGRSALQAYVQSLAGHKTE